MYIGIYLVADALRQTGHVALNVMDNLGNGNPQHVLVENVAFHEVRQRSENKFTLILRIVECVRPDPLDVISAVWGSASKNSRQTFPVHHKWSLSRYPRLRRIR